MDSITTAAPSVSPVGNGGISLSPNYAAGLSIGIFLMMMGAFAVYMMLSIQTSDKMCEADNAYALPQKKEE
jgi:hypothetical protein